MVTIVPPLPKPGVFKGLANNHTHLKVAYSWFDGVNKVVQNVAYQTANSNATATQAYAQANAAYARANVALAEATLAFNTAVNAYNEANASFIVATLAYGQANAAYGDANLAYAAANSAQTEANLVYSVANNAYAQANAAYGEANGAYGQANLAYAAANSAQTEANLVYSTANLAYAAANSAQTEANLVYSTANLAYAAANSAQTEANTIYALANMAVLNVSSANVSNLVIGGNSTNVTIDTRVTGTGGGGNPADAYARANAAGVFANQGLVLSNVINLAFANTATINAIATSNTPNGVNLVFSVNVSSSDWAASANGTAQTAYGQANAAYGQANLAYTAANTAQTEANTVYAQANLAYAAANSAQTEANLVYSVANLAYAAANSAQTEANLVYSQANNAYAAANLAYTAANSAQTEANTIYALANMAVLNVTSSNTSNLVIGGNSTNVTIDTRLSITGGSGSPDSPLNSVQLNVAGAFYGTTNLTYDDSAGNFKCNTTGGTFQITANDEAKLVLISNTSQPAFIQLQSNALVGAYVGVAHASGDLTGGAAANDMVLRCFSGNMFANVPNPKKFIINSGIVRESANGGWLEGRYAQGGEVACTTTGSLTTTGVIYCLGGTGPYVPNAQSNQLGTMYGIGFTYGNQTNVAAMTPTPPADWGMYVASAGIPTIFLSSGAGVGVFQTSVNTATVNATSAIVSAGDIKTATSHTTGAANVGSTLNVVTSIITAGTVTAATNMIVTSDRRTKKKIKKLKNALKTVNSLRGVEYIRKKDKTNTPQIGVIAQEVQKHLPQVVFEGEGGMLGVSYENMAAIFIEAIKELSEEVEELKKQLHGKH